MKDTLFIAKMLGGSRLYGTDTPASDTDWRGVFINTTAETIVGLQKHDHQEGEESDDAKYKELRRWLGLLRISNSEAVDVLYAPDSAFTMMDPLFVEVRKQREKLVDSEAMYHHLVGYSKGEQKRANGVLTGKLGKRKDAIEKHGFSAKNFVQLLRLNWAGDVFFQKGYFPVNVRTEDPKLADFFVQLKTRPEMFGVDELNDRAEVLKARLEQSFVNRQFDYKFNRTVETDFMMRFYYPLIKKEYLRLWSATGMRDLGELKGFS